MKGQLGLGVRSSKCNQVQYNVELKVSFNTNLYGRLNTGNLVCNSSQKNSILLTANVALKILSLYNAPAFSKGNGFK